MRVLLTGATGFIGSAVARALVARGAEVHASVRPGSSLDRLAGIEAAVALHEVDLGREGQVRALVQTASPDAAIHVAWYAEPERYLDAEEENEASLQASRLLLRVLGELGHRRVVMAGTCLESSHLSQTTAYQRTKAAAHTAALQDASLDATCAHIFYVYGPGEDRRRMLPTVIRALLRGEAVAVSEGWQQRDYLHVADVASALCALAESDTVGSVDVCSGSAVRVRDLIESVGAITGRSDLLRFGLHADSTAEGWPASGDPGPLHRLGWKPVFDLDSGLRDTISWWAMREAENDA